MKEILALHDALEAEMLLDYNKLFILKPKSSFVRLKVTHYFRVIKSDHWNMFWTAGCQKRIRTLLNKTLLSVAITMDSYVDARNRPVALGNRSVISKGESKVLKSTFHEILHYKISFSKISALVNFMTL